MVKIRLKIMFFVFSAEKQKPIGLKNKDINPNKKVQNKSERQKEILEPTKKRKRLKTKSPDKKKKV